MCNHSLNFMIQRILADELVQLAMASDGVTEAEMQRVLEQAHKAIIGRDRSAAWDIKRLASSEVVAIRPPLAV